MNPLNRSDLLERSIGREGIAIDRLADVTGVSETQVRRWASGDSNMRDIHLQAVFESPLIPSTFKLQLAESLFPPKCGLRVELCDTPACDENPMRIAINLDIALARIQEAIVAYTDPRSRGGMFLTGAEQADVRGLVAKLEAMACELKSALNGAAKGRHAG